MNSFVAQGAAQTQRFAFYCKKVRIDHECIVMNLVSVDSYLPYVANE